MYPFHQCNLNAGQQSYLKTHIEMVHEKVRYPHCDKHHTQKETY